MLSGRKNFKIPTDAFIELYARAVSEHWSLEEFMVSCRRVFSKLDENRGLSLSDRSILQKVKIVRRRLADATGGRTFPRLERRGSTSRSRYAVDYRAIAISYNDLLE